ncbi:MAG: phytanoyl-CoA dioxygenase family protein [Planctomycetes bacterium]|nr:phytanoyl-CoA dioxygenase family protein [Planctomycetota bacterium]
MASLALPPESLHERFEQQGYVILKHFLEREAIEAVKGEMGHLVDREAEKLLASGKIRDPLKGEPFETRLARLYESCPGETPRRYRENLHLKGMFGILFHPRLLDVVETFLGPEIRLYPNYTVRPKLPNDPGTQVLWHQDGGYTEGAVEQLRMINIWTPLVPARVENGCMQFIPGTHRMGPVPHVKKTHYLEIAEEHLKPRLNLAVDIEADPGDIVLFHNLLFHYGRPNVSRMVRWSVDWRYQDASQSTLRKARGHLARSRSQPEQVVRDAEHWASLSFQ